MQINRTTFVLALVLLGLLPSMAHAQSWYNSSWLYRKAITIDRTKVSAGPHTNIPVLISRTDTDLQTKAQTDADDILFTSADGTTKLDHEIESYTSGTGVLVAWVEIPSLSSATDTVIYMYYGNAAATSQQNVIGTWNTNYRAVWHLNNAFLDATSNSFDGTNTGTTNVAGKISNGRGFVRSNGSDFITVTGLMGSPTSFTLSAWATLTTADPNAAEIISLGDNSVLRYDELSANRTSGVAYNGGGVWTTTGSGNNYAGTGWHYVVYTFDDAGNSQKLYVDGIQVGTGTATVTPVYTSGGTNTFIGKHGNANVNFDFDGTIDEVRVSNVSRSVGWALTEFNNQNAPGTFYAVGSEAKPYYSLANGNWNSAATWSNVSHTGAAASTAPGTADYVVIGNSDIVTLSASATNNNEVEINSTGTLNTATFTISGTGAFTLNSGAQLGIGSTAGITSSGATGNVQVTGTRTFSTGADYIYNGSAAQVTGNGLPATVNDLTINNSTGLTLSAAAAVNGTLTLTSGALSIGSNTLTVNGPITTTSGSLTGGGTSNLTIGGAGASTTLPAITLNNLTMNRANGITLGGNVTVGGVLTFTSGNITPGANTLGISSTGSVSRTSGHVIGNFQKNVATGATSRTFEIGDATTYTPVTVAFASVTTAGNLTASTAAGDHSNIGSSNINSARSVNRNWTLANSGIVFTNYGATFTFVAGDLDGGATTSVFIVGKYSAGWTYPTVGTKNPTNTQTTGLTTFGDFQLGEAAPVTKTWDGGAGTNNWGDANNWNTNGVPISTDDVNLTGANTININVAAVVNNITLNNAGLVLTINTGSTLAVSGSLTLTAGTFNMGTNTVSGAGSFTLGSGGNLGIGSTLGITSSGATGNVQVSGTRTFSTAGNYTYNGTAAQVTGNGLPATVNNLTINNSAGVTLTAGVAVSSDLTVTSGVFTVGAFSLAVTGTTTVTSTLTITSATGAKSFNDLIINGTFTNTAANVPITIAGDLQNNGTFSQGTGTVTFTGATSNTVSGAAATTAFGGGITVNKGVSNANVLDVTSVITMSAGGLTLTNGTFKLSSASTITPFTADITASPYLIPSTAGLWCNGGTMNSPAGGMAWTVQGLIRVSAGTLNAGAVTGNYFAPQAGTNIIIDGGNLILADRLSQLGSVWTFNMTSGTLTVANAGSNTADRPPFNMDQAGSSFSMSGGTIIIARQGGSAGQNLGYLNLATSGTGFTGGTLQIGNGSTPAASTIGITSTNAIYNLTVNAASSTARLQTSALTVTNTVTISAGTLSANNLGLTIGGDWINNVSTTAFTAGTATVTFDGAVAGGSVGGSFATTFNSLTMNRANGISLGANATAGGTLTFTSGNITTGSNNLYLSSTGTVSRTSGHVIGNFRKNVATGATSRTFEIGDATNYAPVTVAFASVTTAGDLTVSVAAGDHANISTSTINAAKSVNRNWTLTNSGIVFTNYNATFTFVAGDVDGGANTANFIVGKYSGGWTYPTVGTKTATTTQVTGLTTFSDFQVGELGATYNISGTVFEDMNYGGGAGRSLASSSGVVRAGARVELFDSGGTYQTFATTDVSGNYTFSGLAAGNYTVRVVNSSVTTSRGVLLTTTPTQTFRTDASSGAAVAVTDHVGGETPGLLDAFDGSTTLAALTTGTSTPQSITSVALSSGNISGVDFGYNFNVIVNANNQGQGSLRRFLIYANAMSNTGLAQSGMTAGIDNAVFMLADGTARPGLTASYATQFAGGVATVALASSYATISDPIVIDATLQPGYTGVPMIQLNGAGAGAGVTGLTITAGGSSVRGLVINGFPVDGIALSTVGGNTVTGNYIGTNAAGSAASANGNAGIKISSAGNIIGGTTAADRNVLSGNTGTGITIDGGTGNSVLGNYIGTNATASALLANGSHGVYVLNGAASNTIGGTAAGAGNLISGNAGKGAVIEAGTGNAIRSNSIYGNTGIGIDLTNDGVTVNDGTKSGALANSGMDTPVFTTTTLAGTTLTISGHVGSAPSQSTFASASVEVFKSDNDASGYGEGQTLLGTLTTDASGNFSGTLTVSLVVGDKITGTATDASNNTSEFGANATVAAAFKTWDGGAGTNNWGDAANWNTDGVPISTDDVDLTGANTININVAAVAKNLTLNNAGLTLSINSGNSLALSGNLTLTSGTFNTANAFPTVTGTVNVAGGTVGFTGSGAQTIPAYNYNNLTSSSSGARTLASSGTIGIAGTFTPGTNTYTITGSTINYNAAGAQTIAAFNYNNLTLSNSGAKTFAAGTSGVASTLSITGSATANATTNSSTISYNGSTNQTITALTYYGLNVSSTGGTVTGINATVTNFSINSGTLDLNTFTLTTTGTATYTSGTINNGTVTSTGATTTFAGTTFGAIVNATSDSLYLNGSTFNNVVTLTKNGATNVLSDGGNTFNNTANIGNSGSGYWALANLTADIFNSNVIFTNTGSNALFMAFNSAGNQFNGTVTFNNFGTGSTINSSFGGAATATYNENIILNNTSTAGMSFGATGGSTTLAATKTVTIGATGYAVGPLYFFFFTQAGTTAQALTLTGTASLTVGPAATFSGNVSFIAPGIFLNGGTYNGTAYIEKNGAGQNNSLGGNVFNGATTLVSSSPGALDFFVLGYPTGIDTFNGDLTLTNTGASGIFPAFNTAGHQFNGNIILNQTTGANISFNAGTGTSTLATGKTISVGGLGFSSGILSLPKFTQAGSTAQAFSMTGTASLQLGPSSTFNGNVNFTAPQLYLNGGVFNGTASFTKTGATNNNSNGGNTFASTTSITNSGTGWLALGYVSPDIFNGETTFNNNSSGGFYVAHNSAGNQFNGNVTYNNLSAAGNMYSYFGAPAMAAYNGNIVVNNTSAGGIYFGAAGGTATLAATKTISIGATGFATGILSLSFLTQSGTTPQALSLTGTALLSIGLSTTFNGNVNFIAPQLVLNGGTFNGTATLTKTGATDNTGIGGSTFNSTATITNSGTGFLRLASTTADDFNSNATFIQTGSGLLQPAYATNSTFAGNVSTAGTATAISFGTGTGTVTLNGTAAQTIAGSLLTTFRNLTINNGSGITLGTNATVNGTLTFTSGTVTTNSNELYLGSAGSVSRSSGHVVGNLKKNVATGATSKTFEIGDASNYSPVTVAFASVTSAGDLTASVVSGDHANIGSSTILATKSVNRNWTLTNNGIVFTNYDATFTFVAGDVDGGASTSAFIVGKYGSGSWTYPTVGAKTATTTQATGLTAFSDFALGELTPLPPNIAHVLSGLPSGPQPPGTDLVYSTTFTNSGGQPAQAFIVVNPIPAHSDFKLGSPSTDLGTTGMTVTVEYSNDSAATWTYTPVSGGGGALAGYDRTVTHVRWRFTGNLPQTAPNNAGSVTVTTRIR